MNFSFFQTNRFRRIKNSEKKKSKDARSIRYDREFFKNGAATSFFQRHDQISANEFSKRIT